MITKIQKVRIYRLMNQLIFNNKKAPAFLGQVPDNH